MILKIDPKDYNFNNYSSMGNWIPPEIVTEQMLYSLNGAIAEYLESMSVCKVMDFLIGGIELPDGTVVRLFLNIDCIKKEGGD